MISRLWRDGNVSIPTSEKIIKEGDRLLVVTAEKDVLALTVLFGQQENTDWNKEDIDWNAIDRQLVSQRIVVTRPELNGKKLGSLRLRNTYGINISRVYRAGVQLLATPVLSLDRQPRVDGSHRCSVYLSGKVFGIAEYNLSRYPTAGASWKVQWLHRVL